MNTPSAISLNTIQEAVEDIRNGKVVIVVDDESRENEGDFVAAAEMITPEVINFMATHGRGLICVSLPGERCRALELNSMVERDTSLHETPFTVSVDLIGHGNTTGISASDRSRTIHALIASDTKPAILGRPGHVFPLKARSEGVLRRPGHTEASMDLARLAGLSPAGVLVEILNDDGSMARLPQLMEVARRFDLKIVTIEDLVAYRLQHESQIEKHSVVALPTEWGDFQLHAYKQIHTGEIHFALVKGSWNQDEVVLTRAHAACVTGDVFRSRRGECSSELEAAMKQIAKNGRGVLLYMNQETSRERLLNRLKAYELQDTGVDPRRANEAVGAPGEMDKRDYGIGAQILRDLGISKIKLLTNHPTNRHALRGYGLDVVEQCPLQADSTRS